MTALSPLTGRRWLGAAWGYGGLVALAAAAASSSLLAPRVAFAHGECLDTGRMVRGSVRPAADATGVPLNSRVIVHRSQADFDRWLKDAQKPDPDPTVRGRKLYTKLGCAQCHSVDGTKITGPSWKDLYGSTQQFTDGSSAVVNEEFLHGFIPAPTAKVPVGFPPVMPPFPIPSNQIDDIAAYMKTISRYAPAPSMGGGAGVGTTQPAAQPTSAPAAK